MDTPILDFARRYAETATLRLHMPGHKGKGEPLDITEIDGADSLYEASGIIAESERNASGLFGCPTFYSTEGSSQCIRAMLYLACLQAGKRLKVLAGRNAHKTFLSGAALLDIDVEWLYPKEGTYLACRILPAELQQALLTHQPDAVYLTCPDYLGNITLLKTIAALCHKHGALLLVDNAHGAYLKFLPESLHPMDLGADMCCDSAHKTLPVLTGGAYLHVKEGFARSVKNALALFGSTSPSYLILQSLDKANRYLAEGYKEKLASFVLITQQLKARLKEHGYVLCGEEPLKITLSTKPYGYEGTAFAAKLRVAGIEPEFADPDFAVLMLTPELTEGEMAQLEQALLSIPRKAAITERPPVLIKTEKVLSIRKAILSPCQMLPIKESIGRVLAAATVGCPPAVPIVVSGERIDENALTAFTYYGITQVSVVK